MKKLYVDAQEVSQALGVSVGKAYQVIRTLNEELKKNGYITVAGKCSRAFLNRSIMDIKG